MLLYNQPKIIDYNYTLFRHKRLVQYDSITVLKLPDKSIAFIKLWYIFHTSIWCLIFSLYYISVTFYTFDTEISKEVLNDSAIDFN